MNKSTGLVLIAALGVTEFFGGCAGEQSTVTPAVAPPVLYDKDIFNRVEKYQDARAANKPPPPIHPYYLAQPSGPFTKEEIFDVCTTIGFTVTNAVQERRNGDVPSRVFLEIFTANETLVKRDPKLAERVSDYHTAAFEKAAALSPDEARQRMIGFPADREYSEFNRSNIMSCYAVLGSWQ